jgi:iron complex transport system substrate-binding protein
MKPLVFHWRVVRFNLVALLLLVLTQFFVQGQTLAQAISLTDDLGRQISLSGPPQRIISLAPHVTELLFAAGLGNKVIAVDLNSDFPPAVNTKLKVGSFPAPDSEALLKLKPDLIVVWGAGFSPALIEQWQRAGIATFVSNPTDAQRILSTLKQLSRWSETPAQTQQYVRAWASRAAQLANSRSGKAVVNYFIQIWDQPLTTLSDQGVWAQASQWCRGKNIFAAQSRPAPTTDLETVGQLRPAVWLLAGGQAPSIKSQSAVLVVPLPDSLLQRPGPRWLDAVEALCTALDRVR